jgi:hypothetical protein
MMSKLQLFGQGLLAGVMIIILIEYFAGFLHIDKVATKTYRNTPDGRLLTVIQHSLLMILLLLCGLASVMIFS